MVVVVLVNADCDVAVGGWEAWYLTNFDIKIFELRKWPLLSLHKRCM
jgi:hypothetical protein